MKEVNIDFLENVLQRIWSGELDHDQSKYFCGTSCCLAGWVSALNNLENYKAYVEDRLDLWQLESYINDEMKKQFGVITLYKGGSPFYYAKEFLNLTLGEARLLFSSYTNKRLHKTILNAFKKNRRFNCDVIVSLCLRNEVSQAYDEDYVFELFCYTDEDKIELENFLGEENSQFFNIRSL